MTTCQLCGRKTDNSAFCSTCEPRASRVADVDSQASQLSQIVGSFPDLPSDFTERNSQAQLEVNRHGLKIKLHNRRVIGYPLDHGKIVFEFRILDGRESRVTRIRLSDKATRAMVRIALELLGFDGFVDDRPTDQPKG
jgi:hypothetical protein